MNVHHHHRTIFLYRQYNTEQIPNAFELKNSYSDLVIIIISLSMYSYNTHTARVADVKRREEAEAKVVKLGIYGDK